VRALRTPGHTRGHQSILIEGRQRSALFLGDVLPTRHHVGRPYNMAYDLFPLENCGSKARILKMASEQDWLIVLDHDPHTPVVRAASDRDWYVLTPVP
jgi:glyoxylase-like metal-dependent hydrolase (beta-lactamase superfamily II)